MGSQLKGKQILDETITEDDIKDGAIKAAELSTEAITGQTLHSGAPDDANDMLLMYDHSTTSLRKVPLGDLMGEEGGGGAPDMIQDADQNTSVSVDNGSDDNNVRFRTAGTERMVISNTGNITIEEDLQVNGDIISSSFKSTNDIVINAVGGDIKFQDNGTQRMIIEDGGNIGIGSAILNPAYQVHIKKSTTAPMLYIDNLATDDTDFIYARSSLDVDPDSGSYLLRWTDNGFDSLYYVRGNGSGGSSVSTSFTAGHDTVVEISDQLLPGMIVESTGEMWYKPTDVTYETALPKCRLTSTSMSKKVFGVVGGTPETDASSKAVIESGGKIINGFLQTAAFTSYGKKAGVAENEVHLNTMSIGEGVVWVTNANGNISNGDLICSSNVIGHGQLQNDDIMRSITVAKCTENISWESVTDTITHDGNTYKKYLVGCTFHCG
jgi:hypothetical protein